MSVPHITASMLAAMVVCPREAWLMSRAFSPEKENYFIVTGNLIHEESYSAMRLREIEIEGAKIDFITEKGGKTIVAEIKRSSASVDSGKIQLLYYMKRLREVGIFTKGQLRIPKEKKIIDVELNEENEKLLEFYTGELIKTISKTSPPEVINSKYCKKCGYQSMCFS